MNALTDTKVIEAMTAQFALLATPSTPAGEDEGDASGDSSRLDDVVGIGDKDRRAIMDELSLLMEEAEAGRLKGITYAATSDDDQLVFANIGSHADTDKAVGALFRVAVSLTLEE